MTSPRPKRTLERTVKELGQILMQAGVAREALKPDWKPSVPSDLLWDAHDLLQQARDAETVPVQERELNEDAQQKPGFDHATLIAIRMLKEEFCNLSLPAPQMIEEAVTAASTEIVRLRIRLEIAQSGIGEV